MRILLLLLLLISLGIAGPAQPLQRPPALLTLAHLSSNVYSGNLGYEDYRFVGNNCTLPPSTCMDSGLRANVYANADRSQIVMAFRGTMLSSAADNRFATYSNLAADVSFGGSVPTATLTADVADAARFLQQIQRQYPKAVITLTGHSLGGAVTQLLGSASGLPAVAFNAPGAKQLYESLQSSLMGFPRRTLANSINVNYRIYGDQLSLFGEPLGTTLTLQAPADAPPLPASSSSARAIYSLRTQIATLMHLHSMDTIILQLTARVPQVSSAGEPNYTGVIQRFAVLPN